MQRISDRTDHPNAGDNDAVHTVGIIAQRQQTPCFIALPENVMVSLSNFLRVEIILTLLHRKKSAHEIDE
jgi:hypothetical protein